jgi:alpha-L-fucosidase
MKDSQSGQPRLPWNGRTGEDKRRRRLDEIDAVIGQGPYAASWDSLERVGVPDWYQDAKFGIFIHWGVYSVPAFGNEWYPRNMYRQGTPEYRHHLETYGPHSRFGYKDFIPLFRADKFDANAWAELFQASGARFVMPVAEHHDGFQMYGSEWSRWNAVEMGPKRDVLGELRHAVEAHGMEICASSHRAEHWWFMGEGRRFDSDVNDPEWADLYGPAHGSPGPEHHWDNYLANPPDDAFLEDWLIRTCEIIDNHRPKVLWFDWWIMNLAFKPWLKKLAAFYYNRAVEWGCEVAINYKYDAFPVQTAVYDVERGQLSGIRSLFWQTDTAVQKNSWGYTENQDYKTVTDILEDLVDIVSKNGALLLNVGPRADGIIPEPECELLRGIGRWLEVNGDAIYGTRPWILFGEGPTKVSEGAFTDTSRAAFTAQDIRFTTKEGDLYAVLLKCPEDGEVLVTSLGDQKPVGAAVGAGLTESVSLLDGNRALSFEHSSAGLRIHLPHGYRSDGPVALRIAFVK